VRYDYSTSDRGLRDIPHDVQRDEGGKKKMELHITVFLQRKETLTSESETLAK